VWVVRDGVGLARTLKRTKCRLLMHWRIPSTRSMKRNKGLDIGVPLLREGHPIGAISLMRFSVRPFTDKQIEIVQNFADQTVIAIENTRLIAQLGQRTDQLSAARWRTCSVSETTSS
jgi:transcriptional regulator with GAF, ATPase, and Fis domain